MASDEQGPEADVSELASAAAGIVAHMNADHVGHMLTMAKAFGGVADGTAAVMTGVDRGGFDMSITTPGGERHVRLTFEAPIADRTGARTAIVAMLRAAEAKLGSAG